jgi:integrase
VVGLRIKMLCRIQRYAADCGVPVGIDAMHRIKLPAIRTRERYLSPLELSALGRAVEAAERDGSITESAARCIRGLALTGMRISEFATLTWDEIDLSAGRICLRDSKTGARIVPIGTEVVRWLTTINRHGAYVCPGRDPSRPITSSGVRHALESVSERAGLRGVTPHVLRHTYATTALQGGEPLSSIQQILGHSNPQTTARYLHVCEHESRVSATRTAGTISGALTGGASEDGDR